MTCSKISISMQYKESSIKEKVGFVVLLLYSYLKVSESLQPTSPFKISKKRMCILLFLSWIIRFKVSVDKLE